MAEGTWEGREDFKIHQRTHISKAMDPPRRCQGKELCQGIQQREDIKDLVREVTT